ncbi:MAG TPA: hypothetical protein VGR55_10430 [Candidatus Acidoferrum sp.]|nr:hypothetical protein [Candidatus Acidoferrum sp.]
MKRAIQFLGIVTFGSFILPMALTPTTRAQKPPNSLQKVYSDESHCLTGPEIRSDKDSPISCYCRDAIVDARYIWHTYLMTGKDPNLNGAELTLQTNATQMCGEDYDVHQAVNAEDWKWEGPEVSRTYPPDNVLRQIKPDSHGMIHYEYTVVLLQRDSIGHVSKTESFTARETEPLKFVEDRSKPKQQE